MVVLDLCMTFRSLSLLLFIWPILLAAKHGPDHEEVKIIFEADNSGIWMLHCHKLSHMEVGMQTTIHYEGYPLPDYYLELIGKFIWASGTKETKRVIC